MDEIVHAPLEPILHPSPTRLWWAGACTVLGHLSFYWIWHRVWPQPYESAVVRGVMAASGLWLLIPSCTQDIQSRVCALTFSWVCWFSLPAFFFWMYWMNHGNAVWLASTSTMLLIYYHLTDWRIATVGTAAGALSAWVLATLMMGSLPMTMDSSGTLVLLFAWAVGLLMGASSANRRRVRLMNTLSTMGVMAHELRTPLATVNLLADVLRTLAHAETAANRPTRLHDLSNRLQHLVQTMNRQIDTQISNAQLLRLPRDQSTLAAAALVHDVVSEYPYKSSRERESVQVLIQQDFEFLGSPALFRQVLFNLIKNALHALASTPRALEPGDLRVIVGLHRGQGRIAVEDKGVGMAPEQLHRIFEPFYSTQASVGSGLGLSFCKNVVEAAQGSLSVHAELSVGAVFMIDLPLASPFS